VPSCRFTDDTVMTLAVASALLDHAINLADLVAARAIEKIWD
jgi:ADP-ribosylglycohydrolase